MNSKYIYFIIIINSFICVCSPKIKYLQERTPKLIILYKIFFQWKIISIDAKWNNLIFPVVIFLKPVALLRHLIDKWYVLYQGHTQKHEWILSEVSTLNFR